MGIIIYKTVVTSVIKYTYINNYQMLAEKQYEIVTKSMAPGAKLPDLNPNSAT